MDGQKNYGGITSAGANLVEESTRSSSTSCLSSVETFFAFQTVRGSALVESEEAVDRSEKRGAFGPIRVTNSLIGFLILETHKQPRNR